MGEGGVKGGGGKSGFVWGEPRILNVSSKIPEWSPWKTALAFLLFFGKRSKAESKARALGLLIMARGMKKNRPWALVVFGILSIVLVVFVNSHAVYKGKGYTATTTLSTGSNTYHDTDMPTILPGHIQQKLPPPKHSVTPVVEKHRPEPTDPKVRLVNIKVSPNAIPYKDLKSTSHASCITPNPFGPQCTMEMADSLISCTHLSNCVALICPDPTPYQNGVPSKNIKGPICQARGHVEVSITTGDGQVIDETNHGMCPCTHVTFEVKGLISEVLRGASENKAESDNLKRVLFDGDYLIPGNFENEDFVKRVKQQGKVIVTGIESLDEGYIVIRVE